LLFFFSGAIRNAVDSRRIEKVIWGERGCPATAEI